MAKSDIKEDIEKRLRTLTQEEQETIINNLLGMVNDCKDVYKLFLPFYLYLPVAGDANINETHFILNNDAKNDFNKVVNKIYNDPYKKYYIVGRIFSMDNIAKKMASIINLIFDLQLDAADEETLDKISKAFKYQANIHESYVDELVSHNLDHINNLINEVASDIACMIEKIDYALSSDFNYSGYSDYYTELIGVAKKKFTEDITILQELLIYIKSFYYTLATCVHDMLLFNIETII